MRTLLPLHRLLIKSVRHHKCTHYISRFKGTTSLNYVQGQSPTPNTREYFYFIDHQGQFVGPIIGRLDCNFLSMWGGAGIFELFLDDARMKNFTSCFKEKDFLVFFFKRLKMNTTGKYDAEFPYFSPCGRERNFVRCDDTPIVFTHIKNSSDGNPDQLCYGGAADAMSVEFRPVDVCMLPDSCRVYHPAPEQYGGIGLIRSSLAIELSKHFEFGEGGDETKPPTHLNWQGTRHTLTNCLFDVVKDRQWGSGELS